MEEELGVGIHREYSQAGEYLTRRALAERVHAPKFESPAPRKKAKSEIIVFIMTLSIYLGRRVLRYKREKLDYLHNE